MSYGIHCYGNGSAFSQTNLNAIFGVKAPNSNKLLLVDCGPDIKHMLKKDIDASRVDAIYITHPHGDHVYGLETFAYYKRYVLGSNEKTKLYLPKEIFSYVYRMISPSFEFNSTGKENLDSFYEVIQVDTDFEWETIQFTLYGLPHTSKESMSYGLSIMDTEKNTSFISGDFTLSLMDSYQISYLMLILKNSDMSFLDCSTGPSYVHNNYLELYETLVNYDVSSTVVYVYHYDNDGDRNKMDEYFSIAYPGYYHFDLPTPKGI